MPSARVCAILLLACPIVAAALSVDLSSCFGWNQDQTSRLELRSGDARLVAEAWRPARSATTGLFAGLSTPWLRAGPLSPAGVIREACNPLGFQAGSDVFLQRTGLSLDTSLPAHLPGVLLMPCPKALGVFYQQLPRGGDWAGFMSSLFPAHGVGVEGFFCIARPSGENVGDEWIMDSAPFAGGRILCGAGRVVLDGRLFGMTAAFGASGAERALPGTFVHLQLMARLEPARVFLLFGKADSTFTSPFGERSRDSLLMSAAMRLEGEVGKADAALTRSVRQPGFPPRPFLSDSTEMDFRVEPVFTLTDDALLTLAAEWGRVIQGSPDGSPESVSRGSLSATLRVAPVSLVAGAGKSDESGLSVRAGVKATLDRWGSFAGFEAAALRLDRRAVVFSSRASARFSRRELSLTLSARVDELGFSVTQRELGERLVVSFLVRAGSQ